MKSNPSLCLLFGLLPPSMTILEKYLDSALEEKIFKHEVVSEQSTASTDDSFLYVKSGLLKVCSHRCDGSELNFSQFGAGTLMEQQVIGWQPDLCDPLHIIACENTVAYRFAPNDFYEILSHNPQVFFAYQNFHADYFRMLTQRTSMTSCLDADQRILGWLLRLCSGVPIAADGSCFIPCSLTQQEIADYLFIHVTTFHRIFTSLKNKKVVEKNRKGFVIPHYGKLVALYDAIE